MRPARGRRHGGSERARTSPPAGAAWLLGSFTVLAPQLLGGATPVTSAWVLGLGAVVGTVAVAVTLDDLDGVPRTALAAVVACVVACAWTGAQLLPIPCTWAAQLSVERAELMTALVGLGVRDADAPCTITGAPGSTRIALLIACDVGLLLTAALQLARRGHGRTLTVAVAASSALMALVALGHGALDATLVFGMYAPQTARTQLVLAPLLNGNHLAGHLVLGIPAMLALAATTQRVDARIGLIGLAVAAGACVALALSRGGTGALVLALAMTAGMLGRRNNRRGAERDAARLRYARWLAGAAAIVGAAALAGWEVLRIPFESEGLSLSKLQLTTALLSLVNQAPWTGMGRGALLDAAPSVTAGTYWVQYAENLPAQWVLEWGIPVSLVAISLFGFALLAARPRTRGGAALRIGVLALAAQNLVDFSLELPALALVSAIALGCVLGDERRGSSHIGGRFVTHASVALAAAAALTCLWIVPSTASASRSAQRTALAGALAPIERGIEARTAFALYPLDPPLIVHATASAVEHDQPNALQWLAVSMRVAGRWGSTHLLAAHYLERHGRVEQAALETSLAAEADFSTVHDFICYFVARHPSFEVVRQLAPAEANRRRTLERLIACLRDRPELALQVGAWALEEEPGSAPLTVGLARAEIMSNAVDAGIERLDAFERSHDPSPELAAGILSNLNLAGRTRDAVERFRRFDAPSKRDQRVLWEAAGAAAAQRDDEALRDAIDRLSAVSGSSAGELAAYDERASRLFRMAGQPAAALRHARRAFDLRPSGELGELVYESAVSAGLPLVALHAAHELCQLRHRADHYCRIGVASTP